MKTSLQKLPKNTLEITVEIAAHDMQPFLDRAAERLSQQRPVAGFRPGKASYAVMEKVVGADVLYHEAAEAIVRTSFPKAVAEHKIETVGTPKIELQKIAPNNPFIYKATVAVLPEVQLGEYRTLKVSRKAIMVSDNDVDKVIAELRDSRATEASVDRAAATGDKVEIDFSGVIDGVPVDGAASKNHPLVLGSNQFIPGFEEHVVGMNKGEPKTFTLRFPKDYHQRHLADREVAFTVTVQNVLQRTLPELNDAFAKTLGNYHDVAALKKQIQKNLEADKRHKERERFETAMLEKIAENSTFGEFPDLLIDSEAEKMLDELHHSVEDQGMVFTRYLESIKKTADDLRKEFRPQAERRVRVALVSRSIAHKEHIEVSDEEVTKEIEATRKMYEGNNLVETNLQSPEYSRYLKNVLTQKRVFEFLDDFMGMNES